MISLSDLKEVSIVERVGVLSNEEVALRLSRYLIEKGLVRKQTSEGDILQGPIEKWSVVVFKPEKSAAEG